MTYRSTDIIKNERATTQPAECEGAACRHGAADRARDLAAQGGRLCPPCALRLTHDLRRLPRLHEECGGLLTGTDRPRDRTSGGPLPGLPFNTAAAEARSVIVATLRSWAALVIDERRVSAPPDTVAHMAGFLLRHIDWLVAHPAVADLSSEVTGCVRRARRVIDPAPRRRLPVGACVVPGCGGTLRAEVRSGSGDTVEVGCDSEPAHRWSGQEWLRRGSRPARREQPVRWMTARDIARLWGLAPGSVYRRASEDRWRRQSVRGRAYYHGEDVLTSLGTHS
ncbi:hypothetical protein [Streptomyces sp. AC04842]|uniref:Helix-turn-helix domain-containing protein n=1 Tax=Streptomyces cellulosae TaxID=1968 RepID=A0ABW6JCI5_STRCE|nr:hypothetical protein [Streptomyces sp. AC04842]GHE66465.1 hypothetical protein GCM10018771_55340 [Streptomyces cellulosae]